MSKKSTPDNQVLKALKFEVKHWVDANGTKTQPFELSDFEGHEANTYEKMVETQKQYGLKIPFGHDVGDDDKSTSNIMKNHRTGGTPWFIFIDINDNIVFADFHLNENAVIEFLRSK